MKTAKEKLIEAWKCNGCLTGDCPHDNANDCVGAIDMECEALLSQAGEMIDAMERAMRNFHNIYSDIAGYSSGAQSKLNLVYAENYEALASLKEWKEKL